MTKLPDLSPELFRRYFEAGKLEKFLIDRTQPSGTEDGWEDGDFYHGLRKGGPLQFNLNHIYKILTGLNSLDKYNLNPESIDCVIAYGDTLLREPPLIGNKEIRHWFWKEQVPIYQEFPNILKFEIVLKDESKNPVNIPNDHPAIEADRLVHIRGKGGDQAGGGVYSWERIGRIKETFKTELTYSTFPQLAERIKQGDEIAKKIVLHGAPMIGVERFRSALLSDPSRETEFCEDLDGKLSINLKLEKSS